MVLRERQMVLRQAVVAGCFDGLTRLYDAANGAPRGTLLALNAEYLAMSPAGYVAVTDGLITQSRWAIANKPIAVDVAWKTLRQPALVSKSFAGQTVPLADLPAHVRDRP